MTTSSVDAVGCIQSRACTSGTNLNLCSSCFPIEIHPYFFFAPTCRASLQTPGTCRALLLHLAPWEEPSSGGLEPSAVLSGVQHRAKKYPKKPLSPHLILSNSSVSPDQIGNIPSHKPLQVCFGQEIRKDGFITDVF